MAGYFDFYDPLEKRYLFNNFLVASVLVEILILFFTLIWQIDEGIFTDQVRVIPFPWKEYLLAAFAAPIVLLFVFLLIVRGFEHLSPEARPQEVEGRYRFWQGRRAGYLQVLLALLALLALLFWGGPDLTGLTATVKALGLGAVYLLIALFALALLYLPLHLWLRYRLQKKTMEYQYLLAMAERYGVVVVDPKLNPDLASLIEEKKNSALPAPKNSPDEVDSG